jgi:hypothetical protein
MKMTIKQLRKIILETILQEEKKKGLWANIHAKRKRGESPAKPGEKGYPKTLDIEEAEHEDVDEYDVVNEQDYKEFKEFMSRIDETQDDLTEAEYRGRKVKLNKPMQGDIAKFKVYVKNPKKNVVKVNFGSKGMRIKKSNPARRKSFRARHKCDSPGPRHKARYWSCRKW